MKSNTKGVFDWEVSASNFDYLQSDQVSPYSGAWPYGGYTQNGKDAVYTGTYWTLLDLKGIVRPDTAICKGMTFSFGLHGDRFHLNNPTWLTTNWTAGTSASTGVVSSIGDGTTQTQALWLQDAWKINPNYKLTLGIRGEHWQASDGYNQSLGGINATGLGSTANPLSTLPIFSAGARIIRATRPRARCNGRRIMFGRSPPMSAWPTASRPPRSSTTRRRSPAPALAANPNPNLRPEVALEQGTRLRTQARARMARRACRCSTRKFATRSFRKISMSPPRYSSLRVQQRQRRPHPQQRRGIRVEEGQCLHQGAGARRQRDLRELPHHFGHTAPPGCQLICRAI